MEAYEVAAAHASSVELRVERYIVDDGGISRDYLGPQLVVIARQGKLVTIDELSRQIEDLSPARMVELVELGFAACDEAQPRIEGHRWILPCGADVIETHQVWRQARRIYVRISDLARGIHVQRD